MRSGTGVNRGFTLIEVVIVTVVIGILAAIAIPSYTAYIVRANRSDARGQVLMAAQWMERFRTQNGTYAGAALPAALKQSPAQGTKKYDIALVSDATSFSLTATPTGSMSGDQCGALTIDHTGALAQGGSTKEICWDR